jgi:hypothetical protein
MCISELHKVSILTSSLCHQSNCELVTQLSFISKSIICNLIEFPMTNYQNSISPKSIQIIWKTYWNYPNHLHEIILTEGFWRLSNDTKSVTRLVTHGGLGDLIVTNKTNKPPSFIIDFCLVLKVNEMSVKNISYLLPFIVKGTIIPLFWVSSTHRVLIRTPRRGVCFNG